ncbi:pyrroline-5-carboxylate reductase [Porticoccus sp. W117]|uniref:pyrroline-5-carboxylate reductase n=1 Tax=Porticoccus sp. W117 TaxID=3054777 RepID=UPI0025966FBE|nr:pyrroline-5-carboxylate reductase [Porticoccus sp. W117]MDM3872044.1 pyrroline-5-carboxylate reductase [Porticoccus sp. W117]
MTDTNSRIAFIGAGNMAGSLIGGLLAHGHPANNVRASTRSQASAAQVQDTFGIDCTTDNRDLTAWADVLVLAVKPQMMRDTCELLADALDHQPLIISVAAGITTQLMDKWLGGNRAIVRCMPNTPSALHTGATGLYANTKVSAEQRQQAQQLLQAVGIAEWVADEQLMDAVTAVSGSGPAYYFLLMELMEKAATELGLDAGTARRLTIQTALGAARMAAQGEHDPAELRRRVTSKNGTTDRAITTFLQEGLADTIRKGMTGARDRGREMAAENKENPTDIN